MSFRSKASVFTSPEGTEVGPLHHCVRLGRFDFVPKQFAEKRVMATQSGLKRSAVGRRINEVHRLANSGHGKGFVRKLLVRLVAPHLSSVYGHRGVTFSAHTSAQTSSAAG